MHNFSGVSKATWIGVAITFILLVLVFAQLYLITRSDIKLPTAVNIIGNFVRIFVIFSAIFTVGSFMYDLERD